MDQEQWRQVQTLFHRAAEKPKEAHRGFVSAASADEEVIAAVLAMLEEDSRSTSPLDRGLEGYAGRLAGSAALPKQIGPYRLDRLLGQGGMGIVYLAHREDLSYPVAIKFLPDAWMSPVRAQRFAAEQRTLAQLNHAFIARIYDASALEDGTPWFAMEYVEGLPITAYCEQAGCTVSQRLRLIRAVAEAVQYSHTRAVIHRDLKPSNILVKPDGTPRLLDFGIAKQLETAADLTRTELKAFTPAYAAPEQIRGEPAGVFTDIYALGVITFELLTGTLPQENRAEAFSKAPLMLPVSPADRADLQVLCATAMHPDSERRYRSADALIRDLDHFLNEEPLEARPDSLRYRARKFIARNRRAVLAGAATLAVTASLTAYLAVRSAAARKTAALAAARTERVQKFMLNLFDAGDATAAPANDLRVVTLVDRGVKEAASLRGEPATEAALYRTLGGIYQRLGKLDQAERLLTSALGMRRRFATDGEIADSLVALGLFRVEQARLNDADGLIREALAVSQRARPRDTAAIAAANAALGKVIAAQGKYKQAVPILEEAVRLQPRELAPELPATLRQLAGVHFFLGNYDLCDSLTKRAMQMHVKLFGDRHPTVAEDLIDIANVAHQRGKDSDAERSLRRALSIYESWYGENHPETASTLMILAQSIYPHNRVSEGQGLLERALRVQESVYGPDHPRVAIIFNELASVALLDGRYEEAERRYTRAIAIYRKAFGDQSFQVATGLANLASVYLRRKEYARAESIFRDVVARNIAALSPEHFNTCVAQIKLGRALVKQNKFAEAEPHSLAGYLALSKQTDPDSSWLQAARQDLAASYRAMNQPEKARLYEAGAPAAKR